MSKHIITSHFVNDKNKDDKPYMTKANKPFKIVNIKVDEDPKNPKEYDGKYLSCMAFNPEDDWLFWEVGDEVNILVEKNGEFWNFKRPSKLDILENRVKILEDFMLGGGKEEEEDLPILEEEEVKKPKRDESIPF